MPHYFHFSSLKYFNFLWYPFLTTKSDPFVSLPASPSSPTTFITARFILPPSQSQFQSASKEVQTTKTLNNLTPPKAAHHPKFKTLKAFTTRSAHLPRHTNKDLQKNQSLHHQIRTINSVRPRYNNNQMWRILKESLYIYILNFNLKKKKKKITD